jgi:hypothetical protein
VITNEENKQIVFSEKYASENQQIKKLLYSFSHNVYAIKKGTGYGFTEAMCNFTRGNLLILSPNNSMIEDKAEGNYKCKKYYSISGSGQSYQLKQLLDYLKTTPPNFQNAVVNLNAEWLLNARGNEELWQLLTKFNVFVDEAHQYISDSSYRNPQGAALELIYNEFRGPKVLSTATPIPFHFDIPKELGFEVVETRRSKEKVKPLGYSEQLGDWKNFVNKEIEKGHLVCVFSNNIDVHTFTPPNVEESEIVNLVGENLQIKLKPYNRGLNKEITEKIKVAYLSSAFFAGFSIPHNCSILIVSEQNNPAYKVNINNAVQAYGRCRRDVYEALYVNVRSKFDLKRKPISIHATDKEVSMEIKRYHLQVKRVREDIAQFGELEVEFATDAGYANRGEIGSTTLDKVHDFFQYNEEKRFELFTSYNFELYDYLREERNDEKIPRPKLAQQLKNLYSSDNFLFYDYLTIKNKLRYKKESGI